MTTVRVQYHQEPEGWWAESPDLEGFVATGDSLHEVRALAHEGLPFYIDEADVDIVEEGSSSTLVVDVVIAETSPVVTPTSSAAFRSIDVYGTPGLGGFVSRRRSVAGVA